MKWGETHLPTKLFCNICGELTCYGAPGTEIVCLFCADADAFMAATMMPNQKNSFPHFSETQNDLTALFSRSHYHRSFIAWLSNGINTGKWE